MIARITGTGRGVPEKILTNSDLEKFVDTTDEWIATRTGIRERRMAREDEALLDFAVPAVEQALEMAGRQGSEIDLVICATVTGDMPFPATAALIQDRIGAAGAAAFDISAACTGFTYALGVAKAMIETGMSRRAVVVGGEVLTKFLDWNDRATCVLFGDGAGAVVLEAEEGDSGVLDVTMHADGDQAMLIYRPGGGSRNPPQPGETASDLEYIKMRGNETFKIAVRSLAAVSREALENAGLTHEDLRWFVPHQANQRIISAVGQRLGIDEEKVYSNIARYGNTSAASIPIALDELNRAGNIDPGDLVLFAAFGSGLTWGAGLVKW